MPSGGCRPRDADARHPDPRGRGGGRSLPLPGVRVRLGGFARLRRRRGRRRHEEGGDAVRIVVDLRRLGRLGALAVGPEHRLGHQLALDHLRVDVAEGELGVQGEGAAVGVDRPLRLPLHLVDGADLVVRPGVLRLDRDHLAVEGQGRLAVALLLLQEAEVEQRRGLLRVELHGVTVGGFRLVLAVGEDEEVGVVVPHARVGWPFDGHLLLRVERLRQIGRQGCGGQGGQGHQGRQRQREQDLKGSLHGISF